MDHLSQEFETSLANMVKTASLLKIQKISQVWWQPPCLYSSTLGGQGQWITCGQEFETSLANMVKARLYYNYKKLGVVAHACNPSTLEGQDSQITCGQKIKTSLNNMEKPHLY